MKIAAAKTRAAEAIGKDQLRRIGGELDRAGPKESPHLAG